MDLEASERGLDLRHHLDLRSAIGTVRKVHQDALDSIGGEFTVEPEFQEWTPAELVEASHAKRTPRATNRIPAR